MIEYMGIHIERTPTDMFGTTGAIIGQVLGFVAVIIGFISYQMKTPKAILSVEIVTSIVFASHYLLIGAFTAVALNGLMLVQCIVYFIRAKKGKKGVLVPAIFTCLVLIVGFLTWSDYTSLFITVGLAIYSFFIGMSNAQVIRFAMFAKAPICFTYNLLVFSLGGILYECSVFTSSLISTVRYYRQKGYSKSRS